ncbi:MAG: ATP phosphoribosyltransferase [Dehalococcoidia bacterium]
MKFALPTGDPRPFVGELLERAGIAATGYEPGSRVLRSVVENEGFTLRVFREKDIPIQVALGNYDLGICGDTSLREVQTRFPLQRLVRVGSLPGPRTEVWLAAAPESGLQAGQVPPAEALAGARIASDLPNMADHFAVNHRIPGYRLLSLFGSADAYPPEDAELVVMAVSGPGDIEAKGLVPLARLFRGGLALIANADSLGTKSLGGLLSRLAPLLDGEPPQAETPRATPGAAIERGGRSLDVLRIALPDGHAQRHTYTGLTEAGLRFAGYEEKTYVRRPLSGIPGVEIKVVRPQDMPQLVAMGVFDLGVTGIDWLTEHLACFPTSPVEMVVDLGRSRYKIGPVVDEAFPADTTRDALRRWRSLGRPVRIASEYPALAERFAQSVQLPHTTIIPINGASEGFVPEDADILIEGSETGTSIRANRLKMLDPFMESTNCVVARKGPVTTQTARLAELISRLRDSVSAAVVS